MFEPRYVILCNTSHTTLDRARRLGAVLLIGGEIGKFKCKDANLLNYFRCSKKKCDIRDTLAKLVPAQQYEDSWGIWRQHSIYRVKFFIFASRDPKVEFEMFNEELVKTVAELVEL